MSNQLPKRTLTGLVFIVLPLLAVFSAFPCSASSKRISAKSEPVIIRQACDDNLEVKYDALLDKYKAQMKNPKGLLVKDPDVKASPRDRDSLRRWYSLMTDRQQYRFLSWPGDDGRFVPSPLLLTYETEKGSIRFVKHGKWKEGKRGLYCVHNNYILVVDGEVVNRNVGVEAFNADKASAEEFAALLGLEPYQLKNIEVMNRDKAMAKWGYKGCNGAIVITTNKRFANKYLVVVDGKVVDRTAIRYPWIYANMTLPEDFEEFMITYGIAIDNINSIEKWGGDNAVKTWGRKGRDGAIVISTMSDLRTPLILVDGKVARVGLQQDFNVTDMTINDYARLLGLNPFSIKSFKVTGNSTKKVKGLSCAKGDVMVEITTK